MYSIAYVTECIRQNTLIPSLEAFTFGLLNEHGQEENLLKLTLGLNPAKEESISGEAIVKTEEVKDEYVEEEIKQEYLEPEPLILKFSKSRGVNVVSRVARRQQNKALSFGDLSLEKEDLKEDIVEPSDIQDANVF